MPETIILPETDPRVGRFNTDGSFASWPAVNLDGGRYDRANAIVLQIGAFFVVVPPLWDGSEIKVGDLAKMMIEPPDLGSDRSRKAKGA